MSLTLAKTPYAAKLLLCAGGESLALWEAPIASVPRLVSPAAGNGVSLAAVPLSNGGCDVTVPDGLSFYFKAALAAAGPSGNILRAVPTVNVPQGYVFDPDGDAWATLTLSHTDPYYPHTSHTNPAVSASWTGAELLAGTARDLAPPFFRYHAELWGEGGHVNVSGDSGDRVTITFRLLPN